MFQTRIAAAVASLGLLVLSAPAFAASPAPKATPCHDASGKFTSCSKTASTSGVTKDANGKCHDSSGKYTTCPTSMKSSSATTMKSTKTPAAMKSPAPATKM